MSPTEPDSDCCVFVLDVNTQRLTLNRLQTEANTVHGERAEEPVACWVMRSGETRGWIMATRHVLWMWSWSLGITIPLSLPHIKFILMSFLFGRVVKSHGRDGEWATCDKCPRLNMNLRCCNQSWKQKNTLLHYWSFILLLTVNVPQLQGDFYLMKAFNLQLIHTQVPLLSK